MGHAKDIRSLTDLLSADADGDWHCMKPSNFRQNHIRVWAGGIGLPSEKFYGEKEPQVLENEINFYGFSGPIALLQKRFVTYNSQRGEKMFETEKINHGGKRIRLEVRKLNGN